MPRRSVNCLLMYYQQCWLSLITDVPRRKGFGFTVRVAPPQRERLVHVQLVAELLARHVHPLVALPRDPHVPAGRGGTLSCDSSAACDACACVHWLPWSPGCGKHPSCTSRVNYGIGTAVLRFCCRPDEADWMCRRVCRSRVVSAHWSCWRIGCRHVVRPDWRSRHITLVGHTFNACLVR